MGAKSKTKKAAPAKRPQTARAKQFRSQDGKDMLCPTRGATIVCIKNASAYDSACEFLEDTMKKPAVARPTKAALRFSGKGSGSGGGNGNGQRPLGPKGRNGQGKTELEQAVQRYVDLFEFAPIGYVTFDRVGRIDEVNASATGILGWTRKALVGAPFAMCVARADTQHFLHHLLRCRVEESRVETELHLKRRDGTLLHVLLSSMPTLSSMKDGARLYQTAIVDLTEHKRAAEELRRSEGRYRTLFDAVPVAVYTCDAKGLILEFNRRAAELWGREPRTNDPSEKFCGSFKMFYPDGRQMRHEDCPMARVLRGENMPECDREIEVERKDGVRRFVAVNPTALKNHAGKIVGAINCFYDVTERRESERSLAEAAQQRDAFYRFVERRQKATSVDDIYAAALEVVLSTLHCDRAAILLYDDANVMRFVVWRGLSQRYRRAVEGHAPWKRGVKNPRPIAMDDVELSDISKSLKAMIRTEGIRALAFIPLVAEGKLIGKVMVYYDGPHPFRTKELNLALNIAAQLALGIERMRAEAALRESEELHRAFVSQTEVGMARSDLKGRLVFVNKKFCEMLGYEESELTGRKISDLTHDEYLKEMRRLFRRLLEKGTPYHMEKRYIRKDGSLLWVNVSASPIRDARGKTRAAAAVIRDISERKQAQNALENAKQLLERRVQERTGELRAVIEELQSEISRRQGLEGEILEISEREKRLIGQELHDSVCQHLTAIAFMARSMAARLKNHRVVDVQDIEKIAELINEGVTDTRTIARGLHPVEMNPNGLVAAVQSLLHRRCQLPYRMDMDEELSIADPAVALHLYRIASEAIINANKHARAGELVLRMRSSPKQIELSVTDDGVGLGQKSGGQTGMGFHIMEYRARSIGARLEITPVRPHGTRVACYLPRQ
jgi:PAS domain S-box-containing protein